MDINKCIYAVEFRNTTLHYIGTHVPQRRKKLIGSLCHHSKHCAIWAMILQYDMNSDFNLISF
jgi:hypothetical protein